jgi:hypothetical protein
MKFTRRMARKLSCMRAEDVQRPARERFEASRAIATTSRHTAAADTPEGSRARRGTASSSRHTTTSSSSYSQDELEIGAMFDAPQVTQTQTQVRFNLFQLYINNYYSCVP